MPVNTSPLKKVDREPANAKLLSKLLEFKATGRPIDLWMTFPQSACCFAFGPNKGPVPIGALFLLWSAGWPYRQKCPECQGEAYMVAFGGFLSTGGGHLICPTCGTSWFQFLGGLGRVANEYLHKSPLIGTEFRPSGMLFGGAYTSDGKRLRDFLGVHERPEVGLTVSYEVGKQKFGLRLELGFETLKNFVKGKNTKNK